jgi:hypothetical protein
MSDIERSPLPAMTTTFREEEVDLSLLPDNARDRESQAFVDGVMDLYRKPYEGQEGRFSCSYAEGQFKISWIPLGDPGTEMMTIRWHLEEGRTDMAVPLLEQLLEREPNNVEGRRVLLMILSGHRLVSDC